jgi:predicted nucleotidyltransferase
VRLGVKACGMTAEEETIVRRVRLELEKLYGNRLRKVILYGSRARGDAHEESDYDFLAVLDSLVTGLRKSRSWMILPTI